MQVPIDGVLKRMVMFLSAGEYIVLRPDSEATGGGNWPAVGVGFVEKTISAQPTATGRAWKSHCRS